MAAFCIQPQLAAKLKEAARNGDITMQKLFDMSSDERTALFSKYADETTAREINTGFEKAMVSEQKNALAKWAQDTFSAKEKATAQYKSVLDKINELDQKGLLTPKSEKEFLKGLVAEKLGVTITPEEAKGIAEKAKVLDEAKQNLAKSGAELGVPGTKEQNEAQINYWKAEKATNDYLLSLNPSSNLKVITSTISRANFLAQLHTQVLNVESQAVNGALEGVVRRISNGRFNGLNNDFAHQLYKSNMAIYKVSGYDIARYDPSAGDKVYGEHVVHSQGDGWIRKVARLEGDFIFGKVMGIPDVAFGNKAFTDSLNLHTTRMAKSEGLKGPAAKTRALEIMKDAARLEPKTAEGRLVKAKARADALYATNTGKTISSDVSMAVREALNIATRDLRLGDQAMPFIRRPANVIEAGLDYAGVTIIPKTLIAGMRTMRDYKEGVPWTDAARTNFANLLRASIAAGIGITMGYILSNIIQPKDFIGQYPVSPKERELLDLRNATPNSIRIGNRWVSLDYLGVLGAPLLGWMYARKYGKNLPDFAYEYMKGAIQPIQNLPGLNQATNILNTIQKSAPNGKNDLASQIPVAEKALLGFVESRIVPGLVYDAAQVTDSYQRDVNKNDALAAVENRLPGLRQGLPIKQDLFGDKVKTEPWLDTILFGSRVKTAQDSVVLNQLVKMDQQGELPSITDVSQTSPRAKLLKQQIGDKQFQDAMHYFGSNLKQDYYSAISDPSFGQQTVQDQVKQLNSIKEQDFNDMLSTYGYTPPPKQ